jgi:hypothetical protein
MNFPVAWSRHSLALAEDAVKAQAITMMMASVRCIVASVQTVSRNRMKGAPTNQRRNQKLAQE